MPGTNVLETTWHTPTGWLIVWDLLVMGPAPTDERRDRYRRVPGDTMGQGTLLRIATCCDGRVEVAVELHARSSTTAARAASGATTTAGYEQVTCPLRRPRARPHRAACASASSAPRTYGRTTLEEGESAWLALSWDGHAPTTLDEATAQRDGHREVLARLARAGRRSTTTRGGRTSSAARWR